MSSGLIALLDDVVALTKLAAVALDDAAAQTTKAGSKAISKAAGIVIDDAAVTPRYVVGFAAKRELPIIIKIAVGSLRNKILFLLPGAVLLSSIAPFVINPLLMIGGAFLCYEGWHKVADLIGLHPKKSEDFNSVDSNQANEVEKQRIQSAIRTDFILSAEIMAITLSTVVSSPVWMQASVLALVGLGMTLMVYVAVAVIVKLDDFGSYLFRQRSAVIRLVGRGIVLGMPVFLQLLTLVGMVAMLWVGGGILLHGLAVFGVSEPENWMIGVGNSVVATTGNIGAWSVKAAIAAVVGLVVGALVDLGVVAGSRTLK